MKLLGKREEPLAIDDRGAAKERRDPCHGLRIAGSSPPRGTKVAADNEAKEALLGGAGEPDGGAPGCRSRARRAPRMCRDKVSHHAPVPLDRYFLQASAVEELSEAVLQLSGGDGFHAGHYIPF